MPNNNFTTKRLLFRPFELTDFDPLSTISADPVGSQYVGDGQPLSAHDTRFWIRNSRDNIKKYGYGTGAVVHGQLGQLIGWAGIARPGDGTQEIIYGLDQAFWGQGYGSEILAGLIQWATQDLGLNHLRATVHPKNTASVRLLRSQGFGLAEQAYEGDLDCDLYTLTVA